MTSTRSRVTLMALLPFLGLEFELFAQPSGLFVSPRPVAGVNGPSFDITPTVSADDRTMVFVSDRPPSVGTAEWGTDLWIATREDASDPFGTPTRLEDTVNTDNDEWSPLLTPDGLVLIFSSYNPEIDSVDVYVVTRDAAYFEDGAPVPFADRRRVEELSAPGSADWVSSLDRHGNLYLHRGVPEGGVEIHVARFDRETLEFSESAPICGAVNGPTDDAVPAISWDGRVLLWGDLLGQFRIPGNAQIHMAWRDAPDVCFADVSSFAVPLGGVNQATDWGPRFSYDWPREESKLYWTRPVDGLRQEIWEATWRPDPNARELVDDFEDGDFLDGDPIDWVTCGDGDDRSIVDGDLVLGPSPSDADVRTAEAFSGDVSVRAQGRVSEGNYLQLTVHETGEEPCNELDGYAGGIGFDDQGFGGWFGFLDHGQFQFFGKYRGIVYDPEIDYVMELSTRRDMVELRLWREGEPRPEQPQLSQIDTTYRAGRIGIRCDARGSGVYRYARVAWRERELPPDPRFRRADADGSGDVELTDAVYTLNFLFLGGDAPSCADAADADDSGEVELTDAVFTLNWLFLGGSAPPEPSGAGCGVDGSVDTLGCEIGPSGCSET